MIFESTYRRQALAAWRSEREQTLESFKQDWSDTRLTLPLKKWQHWLKSIVHAH
ncbi:hypothetical protein [Paenibacillus sp. HB172176]|uniref:hypothetical protein n=1 Tax=Paenibacillus sp. HB172176 TaxID=2493690 RepID=UPI00143870CA|nr:hypothetical protein [Paenibacillus sp. HB172176]